MNTAHNRRMRRPYVYDILHITVLTLSAIALIVMSLYVLVLGIGAWLNHSWNLLIPAAAAIALSFTFLRSMLAMPLRHLHGRFSRSEMATLYREFRALTKHYDEGDALCSSDGDTIIVCQRERARGFTIMRRTDADLPAIDQPRGVVTCHRYKLDPERARVLHLVESAPVAVNEDGEVEVLDEGPPEALWLRVRNQYRRDRTAKALGLLHASPQEIRDVIQVVSRAQPAEIEDQDE